jgi:hypothetical protein
MGYPMSYRRVVNRNSLHGGYDGPNLTGALRLIAGDLRRLEQDQRDPDRLAFYASAAGITPDQACKVLDAFFGDKG